MDSPTIVPAEPRKCRLCEHYYITHDAIFPYGCRALGFKSRNEPARDVAQASGEECLSFTPKRRDGGVGRG
jgi:hypothetical protein